MTTGFSSPSDAVSSSIDAPSTELNNLVKLKITISRVRTRKKLSYFLWRFGFWRSKRSPNLANFSIVGNPTKDGKIIG